MITEEVLAELSSEHPHRTTVVLFGIEAHVCILQTALDLLDLGYTVLIVADAVSSIRYQDRLVGITRAQQEGTKITTSESIIFELIKHVQSKHFKPLMPIIRDVAKDLMAHL
uniref:Isochorismatase-like domain-containing protein n=1 Tax=Euplotes harpa TaxID=151035 RepID=A0A7S3J2U1_9SPIT|mmetsp:Transcript_13971/g.16193  ORF Transcript_13971/g.16193 Transcript_13971/m.16193 type:complete len:112 (+) Transcript_13971:274-609(+)